ncbi:MAG: amidohydrolase family protein [Bacteroidia bacterium]|nr:amidohydrolase family protein [Bacteroidia bacterium]
MAKKKPLINAHVHIFTGEHVPPLIAKKFIPWPLYRMAHVHFFLWIWKTIRTFNKQFYDPKNWYNRLLNFRNRVMSVIDRNKVLLFLWRVVQYILFANTLLVLCYWLRSRSETAGKVYDYVSKFVASNGNFYVILDPAERQWLAIALFLVVFFFFKSGRNLVLFALKQLVSLFKALPGSQTRALLERYLLLGKYTLYKEQNGIYNKLEKQYEPNTKFVVLPMDMEYMDAGKPPTPYLDQMKELEEVKKNNPNTCIPFVFVDPRRLSAKDGKTYFDYTFTDGRVSLVKGCFIQKYIEDKGFGGFKIYPALGYYPFDEWLLPVWKYAADNGLPITTHCIEGTIFYRGTKEKQWDKHPVFRESKGDGVYDEMALPQRKNEEFSLNFTHPMNYLCLIKEPLLRILVGQAKDNRIKELFGYTDEETPLKHNLSHLKICLAHFGGEDQWEEYLEKDSYVYPQQVVQYRDRGLDFSIDPGSIPWGRFEQHWKYVDWYSIIYSLMAQGENVYADISYIVSKPSIFPLLKETVDDSLHPKVASRVLFGTDFYVVRNHNSDKELYLNSATDLSEEEMDRIARENTHQFVTNSLGQ